MNCYIRSIWDTRFASDESYLDPLQYNIIIKKIEILGGKKIPPKKNWVYFNSNAPSGHASMHWSQRVQKPLRGTFSPDSSLSMSNGQTSIQSPHSLHKDGVNSILFLLTFSPLISFSISTNLSAPSGHVVAHAPHLMQWNNSPLAILIASVGQTFVHSRLNLHLSASNANPVSVAGLAGPNSTSYSIASTGQTCAHKPQYVHISGNSTVKEDGFSFIKSPGHSSKHMLHPIQASVSNSNF